ncbi:hypothetical protein ACFQJC_00565 [Haloferax namakaokahaiae]|uniref:DUF7344 domain-containing protein n=1 Tax=Haloferax namakaokahaiae TaxID=1748331 RepID=A0ABD5Z9S7_9EURY
MPSLKSLTDHDELLNEAFDALGHEYRRRVLYRLAEDGELSGEFCSTPVLGEQTDPDILSLQLYHVHLPKLDTAGFIDWDRDGGSIRRGERFEAVVPLLEMLAEQDDRRV